MNTQSTNFLRLVATARLLFACLTALLVLGTKAADADGPLIDLSATNVTDALANVRGGLRQDTRYLDKLDLTAAYLGDNHDHPGLSAFLDLQATDGTDFSGSVVGDAQVVSNIDAPAGMRVLDAWVAKEFEGSAGLKAGIIDLNSEFDVHQTGALFLNSAHGIGSDFSQAGENGPSIFPSTGLGFIGWWLPGGHWQLKVGIFEGTPGDSAHPGRSTLSFSKGEGALLVFEALNHITPDIVVSAGTWRYTASFDAIDSGTTPRRVSGNSGVYAMTDDVLYADPAGDGAGLAGWIRVGFADDRVNSIDATLSGGLVYTAPFDRKTDQVGLSFAYAQWGKHARLAAAGAGSPIGATETDFEATYSLALSEALTLQPDIQYVVSPGADPSLADALVVGSRITVVW